MDIVFLSAEIVESAIAAEPPFSERLVLAMAGPVVGALLGTGLIGLIVWKITDRVQNRRAAANLALEQKRTDGALENQLRMDFLTASLSAAGRLYLECNRFWRLKDDTSVSDEQKLEARKALDEQYLECRAAAMVLEARLEATFELPAPAIEWHRIDDLLTVRYMRLVGQNSDRLYEINAKGYGGKFHSGLSVKELHNDGTIIKNYHLAMKTLTQLILTVHVLGIRGRG